MTLGASMPSMPSARTISRRATARRTEQKGAAGRISLIENVMAVVEVIELLCEREDVLGQQRRFRGVDCLIDDGRETRRREPRLPDAGSVFAVEYGFQGGALWKCCERLNVRDRGLAKDIGGTNAGVLNVGSGFAFKAECVLEVERNDGIAIETQHEVTQCADGELPSNL